MPVDKQGRRNCILDVLYSFTELLFVFSSLKGRNSGTISLDGLGNLDYLSNQTAPLAL